MKRKNKPQTDDNLNDIENVDDIENLEDNNQNQQDDNQNNNNYVDNRTVGEKVEDGLDTVFQGIEQAIYGDPGLNNIPATIVNPQDRRTYVKHATRRNISLKLFKNKKFAKVFFGILILGIIGFVAYEVIAKLLIA